MKGIASKAGGQCATKRGSLQARPDEPRQPARQPRAAKTLARQSARPDDEIRRFCGVIEAMRLYSKH
jgi:hypothetical protein